MNMQLVWDIKKLVSEKFGATLHYHDTCGSGMYFSLDERNDEVIRFIETYFKAQNLQTEVSKNGLTISVN